MDPSEYELLSDFLYEAIFQRDENNLLPREIIQEPALRIYIEDFGEKKHDHCLCAVADDVIVGAVWTRIIKGYGSIDDSIPEFAVSIRRGFRRKGIGTALTEQMIELLKMCIRDRCWDFYAVMNHGSMHSNRWQKELFHQYMRMVL